MSDSDNDSTATASSIQFSVASSHAGHVGYRDNTSNPGGGGRDSSRRSTASNRHRVAPRKSTELIPSSVAASAASAKGTSAPVATPSSSGRHPPLLPLSLANKSSSGSGGAAPRTLALSRATAQRPPSNSSASPPPPTATASGSTSFVEAPVVLHPSRNLSPSDASLLFVQAVAKLDTPRNHPLSDPRSDSSSSSSSSGGSAAGQAPQKFERTAERHVEAAVTAKQQQVPARRTSQSVTSSNGSIDFAEEDDGADHNDKDGSVANQSAAPSPPPPLATPNPSAPASPRPQPQQQPGLAQGQRIVTPTKLSNPPPATLHVGDKTLVLKGPLPTAGGGGVHKPGDAGAPATAGVPSPRPVHGAVQRGPDPALLQSAAAAAKAKDRAQSSLDDMAEAHMPQRPQHPRSQSLSSYASPQLSNAASGTNLHLVPVSSPNTTMAEGASLHPLYLPQQQQQHYRVSSLSIRGEDDPALCTVSEMTNAASMRGGTYSMLPSGGVGGGFVSSRRPSGVPHMSARRVQSFDMSLDESHMQLTVNSPRNMSAGGAAGGYGGSHFSPVTGKSPWPTASQANLAAEAALSSPSPAALTPSPTQFDLHPVMPLPAFAAPAATTAGAKSTAASAVAPAATLPDSASSRTQHYSSPLLKEGSTLGDTARGPTAASGKAARRGAGGDNRASNNDGAAQDGKASRSKPHESEPPPRRRSSFTDKLRRVGSNSSLLCRPQTNSTASKSGTDMDEDERGAHDGKKEKNKHKKKRQSEKAEDTEELESMRSHHSTTNSFRSGLSRLSSRLKRGAQRIISAGRPAEEAKKHESGTKASKQQQQQSQQQAQCEADANTDDKIGEGDDDDDAAAAATELPTLADTVTTSATMATLPPHELATPLDVARQGHSLSGLGPAALSPAKLQTARSSPSHALQSSSVDGSIDFHTDVEDSKARQQQQMAMSSDGSTRPTANAPAAVIRLESELSLPRQEERDQATRSGAPAAAGGSGGHGQQRRGRSEGPQTESEVAFRMEEEEEPQVVEAAPMPAAVQGQRSPRRTGRHRRRRHGHHRDGGSSGGGTRAEKIPSAQRNASSSASSWRSSSSAGSDDSSYSSDGRAGSTTSLTSADVLRQKERARRRRRRQQQQRDAEAQKREKATKTRTMQSERNGEQDQKTSTRVKAKKRQKTDSASLAHLARQHTRLGEESPDVYEAAEAYVRRRIARSCERAGSRDSASADGEGSRARRADRRRAATDAEELAVSAAQLAARRRALLRQSRVPSTVDHFLVAWHERTAARHRGWLLDAAAVRERKRRALQLRRERRLRSQDEAVAAAVAAAASRSASRAHVAAATATSPRAAHTPHHPSVSAHGNGDVMGDAPEPSASRRVYSSPRSVGTASMRRLDMAEAALQRQLAELDAHMEKRRRHRLWEERSPSAAAVGARAASGVAQGGAATAAQQQPQQEGGKQAAAASRQHGSRAAPSSRATGVVTPGQSSTAPHAHQQPASSRASISATTSYAHQLRQSSRRHQGSVNASADREANAVLRSRGDSSPAPRKPPASARFAPLPSRDAASSSSMHNATLYEHQHSPLSALPSAAADRERCEWARETPRTAATVSTAALQQRYEALLDTLLDEVEREEGAVAEGSRERKETPTGTAGSTARPSASLDDRKRPSLRQRGSMSPADVANRRPGRCSMSLCTAQGEEEEQALRCAEALRSEFYQASLPPVACAANQTSQKDHRVTNTTQSDDHGAAAAAKVLEQLEVSYAQSLRPSCSSCRPQQLDEYVTLGLLSVLHSLEMHNTRSGNGLHSADGTGAQKSAAGEAGAGALARHKSSQRSSRLLQRGIREELYAAPRPSQRRKRIHQQQLQEEALRHSPHKSLWVGNTVDQAAVALASAPLTRSPCGVPQPAPHPFTPPSTLVFAALLSRLLKAEAQGRQRIEQEEAGEERRTLHRLYIVETVCFLRALHAREQEAVVVVPVLTRRSLRDALARSSDDPHSVHEPVTPAVVQSSGLWRVPAASSSASSGTRSGGGRRHDGFPAGNGAAAGRHSSDDEEGEEESAEYGRIDTADRHRRVRSWRGATPPPSPRQHAGHFTDGSDGTSVPRSSRTCTAALESSRGGEAALSSGARSRHGDPDAATQCGSHSDRPAPSPLMPVPMMTSLKEPRETRNQESGDHCDDGGAGAAGKDAPRSASGGGRLKVSSQTSLCTAAEKNAAPSDLSPQSATEEAERSESAHSWSSSSSSKFSFASHDADQHLADSKPVFPDTAKQAEERDGSRRAIASESTEDSSTPLFELQESSRSTSAGEEGSPPSASIAQTPSARPDEKKVGDSASTDHANAAPLRATEPRPLESSAKHDGKVEKTNNSTEAGKRSTHSPSSSSPSSSSSLEFQLDEDDDAEEEKQREDSVTESQDDEAAPSLRPVPAADATPLTSTPVMPPLEDSKEKEHMERGDEIEEKGSRSSSASLSAVQERGEDAGVADRVPNAAEATADVRGDDSDREVVGAVASASTSPLPPQEAPAPVATSQQRGVPAQSDSEATPDDAEAPSGIQTALDASRRPLSIDRGDHNSQSANSAATSSASLPSSSSSSSSSVSLPLHEEAADAAMAVTDLDKAEAEMESALDAAATYGRVDDTQNPVDSVADSAQSPHSTPPPLSHQEENPTINAVDNRDDGEDGVLADPFTEHAPSAHQEGEKRDSDEDDDGDRFVVHTRVVEAASASAAVDHAAAAAAAATADASNEAEALMESSEAASAPSTQRGEQPEQSEEPTPSSSSSSMAEDGAQPPLLLQQEQEAEDTAGHTVEGGEHDQRRREAADRVEGGQGEQDGSSASDTHGTAETNHHQQQQQQQQRPRRVRFSLPLEHAHKHHDNGEDNAEEEKKDGVDAADAGRGREMGDATGSVQDGLTGVPRDAATPEKLTGRSAESSAEQHSRLTKAQGNIDAEEEEKGDDNDDSVSEKTAVELLEKLNGLDALLLYKFPTYFTKGTDTDGLPGAVMRRGRDTYTPRRSMSHRTSLADAQPAVEQRAADSSGQELPSADVGATVSRGSNGSAPASGSVSPARAPAGTLQHTNSVEATAATQAAAAASGAASPSPSAERSTALAPPHLPAESLATQLRRKYGLRQPRPLTALLPPSVSPAASTSSQPGAPALEHVYPRRLSHDVPVLPSPLHTYATAHRPPTAQEAGRGVATALGSAAASLSKGRDVRRSSAAAMTSEDTRRATSESLDGAAPYAPHVKDLPSPEPHPPAQEEEEGGGGRHHQHQHPQYVMRDESVRAEHASEEMRAADSVAAPLVFSSVDRHAGSQRTPPVPSSTPLAGARRDSGKAALLLHQPHENTKEVLLGSHADSDGGAAQAHRGSPPPVMSIPATTASASATLHRVPSSQRVHSDESSTSSDSSPLTVSIGGEKKKQQQQRSTTTEDAVAVGQSSPPEPPATAPPRRASEWF